MPVSNGGHMKQMDLKFRTWGGKRRKSGRKRIHSKGVAHRVREKVTRRTPLHINFKYRAFIRNKQCLALLKKAILNSRKHGLRILQFSLQSNHIHLIVEAESNEVLTKGMRSLCVTFAMGLDKGRVQVERYHLHVLKGIREARNAIHYVLFNKQKHERSTSSKIDEYTSLLGMERGLELIRKFVMKNRMIITVERKTPWVCDQGVSFIYKNGLAELYT
jgi:REP element-mobilizing transposase RayT